MATTEKKTCDRCNKEYAADQVYNMLYKKKAAEQVCEKCMEKVHLEKF